MVSKQHYLWCVKFETGDHDVTSYLQTKSDVTVVDVGNEEDASAPPDSWFLASFPYHSDCGVLHCLEENYTTYYQL
jgi:hypothetical protein